VEEHTVNQTIPKRVVTNLPAEYAAAFRQRIDIPAESPAIGWAVFALATRFLRRPGAARLVGYQFVPIQDDKSEVLEAPLDLTTGIHIVNGALAGQIRSALDAALEIADTERSNAYWELRSLRIPALYLGAIWLHSLTGRADIVVPYLSFEEDILHDQRYRLATFLDLATKAVRRRGVMAF
jgi:hypothetical protein